MEEGRQPSEWSPTRGTIDRMRWHPSPSFRRIIGSRLGLHPRSCRCGIVAFMIARVAYHLVRDAAQELMDRMVVEACEEGR